MTEIAQQATAIGSSSAKYQGCYLAFSWQPKELPEWLRETGEEEVRCINLCIVLMKLVLSPKIFPNVTVLLTHTEPALLTEQAHCELQQLHLKAQRS